MKWKYIGKRILLMVPTFLGVTILTFVLASLMPGDPIEMIFGANGATKEVIEALQEKYGLNQPIYVQYFTWLKLLLQGDWGTSYRTSEPVLGMITSRIWPTLLLMLSAMTLSIILAIPGGIYAASKPYSIFDYSLTGLSFLATATPNFFMALLFVYVFSVKLHILPFGGMYTTASNPNTADLIRHMILPVIVLTFLFIGNLIRQMRGSMLEVLQEDYIRTAREKGLRKNQVLIKHAARNSLIPVVTTISMNVPTLIGGAVVTEQIFSWPGLGTLMIQSINARDYSCIMGLTVFITCVVLVSNLLTDLAYGLLDPRISYQ